MNVSVSVREPLVSVIIPYYNAAGTICQAVDSALAQKVPLEILVIDDGSAVPAEEILRDYQDGLPVRVIRLPENAGVAAARNRGIREAAGRYVAFLDADDWWEEKKLAAQIVTMRKTGAVLSCTARELMYPDGRSMGRIISVPARIRYRDLLAGNCINCSSVLMERAVAAEFPMEHDDAHEDYILWLKVLRKYREAAGLPHPYLKYRLSAGGKSGGKGKSALMTWKVYRYMGYGVIFSSVCFLRYAARGVWNYFRPRKIPLIGKI